MKTSYVSGSPYECGVQVGLKNREEIGKLLDLSITDAKNLNLTWDALVEKSKAYYINPPESCQKALEFFEGVAEGAKLSPSFVRAMLVEELYSTPAEKCTDVVVKDIIGHNNDLSRDYLDLITHTCMDITNFGRIHLIGPAGFYISVGLNSFGLVLTGSELSPNDEKVGVPRSVVAFSILFTKSLDEAVTVSTVEERASSYNNIIVCSSGAVSVEGSATNYELIKSTGGVLAHANHYIHAKMLKYEIQDTGESARVSSNARYLSAKNQAESLVKQDTSVSVDDIKHILCSHQNGETNNSVCRHGEHTSTVFSFVYKHGAAFFEVASGNPCKNFYEKVYS